MKKTDSRTALLLLALDQAFGSRGWHGTTLRGALRGVTPAQARWRPGRGRVCIWEYVLHCAWWKHEVRRRLGEAVASFPRSPRDWPARPASASLAAWRADVQLLETEQRELRALAARMPARLLEKRAPKSRWRHVEQLLGVAAHDAYHTGQIQLIKRLATATKS